MATAELIDQSFTRISAPRPVVVESPPSPPKQLPVYCPRCQSPIQVDRGLCGNRLIDAILLQSERMGAELECRECDLRFVFYRPTPDCEVRNRVTVARG